MVSLWEKKYKQAGRTNATPYVPFFTNGGLIVILLCACKLAFQASSSCVKIIEFSLKNEARKAYLHAHKRIIIMPAIYERGL